MHKRTRPANNRERKRRRHGIVCRRQIEPRGSTRDTHKRPPVSFSSLLSTACYLSISLLIFDARPTARSVPICKYRLGRPMLNWHYPLRHARAPESPPPATHLNHGGQRHHTETSGERHRVPSNGSINSTRAHVSAERPSAVCYTVVGRPYRAAVVSMSILELTAGMP